MSHFTLIFSWHKEQSLSQQCSLLAYYLAITGEQLWADVQIVIDNKSPAPEVAEVIKTNKNVE